MPRFDDNTSPRERVLEQTPVSSPRSRFNLSHVHSGQTLFGILAPVLCMETLPGDEFDINLAAQISLRNPTPRQLINGCRVYFHAYYNRNSDLWEGFPNFVSKGIRQDVNLKKPRLVHYHSARFNDATCTVSACTPLSLMNYMGLPVQVVQTLYSSSASAPLQSFRCGINFSSDWGFSKVGNYPEFVDALPFVAYQKNWRDFYAPTNLLRNNKSWFPDNEKHFCLPYSCEQAVALFYEDPFFDGSSVSIVKNLIGAKDPSFLSAVTPEPNNPSTTDDGSDPMNCPNLAGIKFRSFRGDRFVNGSPFVDLIRGDIPSINDYVKSKWISLQSPDGMVIPVAPSGGSHSPRVFNLSNFYPSTNEATSFNSPDSDHPNVWFGMVGPSITLNDIRSLETMTVMRERLARTDGKYDDWVYSMFGVRTGLHDGQGTYIGGCYQDIVFNSVTQTSASTEESPLGTQAGNGYSSGNGRIGHFRCPDYGWIQIYMSIVPETYYTQGIERQFTRKTSEDIYNPLWNNLAPQAIRNDELYVSGTAAKDKDVFAYEQRANEFRSKMNRVSGFSSLSHTQASFDSAIVMARRFIGTPELNSRWLALVPENVDMDVFSFNDEPPFDFQVGFDIDAVRPIPKISVPGSMSSNFHA